MFSANIHTNKLPESGKKKIERENYRETGERDVATKFLVG